MSRVRPFHPLLSAVLPVLLIYSGNVDQTSMESVLRPTAVILAASLILWAIFALVFRSVPRAAVLVSLCLFFFFSFGTWVHVTRALVWLVAMVLGLASAAYLLARTRSRLADLTAVLNVVTLCVAAVLVINLTYQLIVRPAGLPEATTQALPEQRFENLPDIYYIILDGYGGADILSSIYEFDNSGFLDQLRERGFRICERSLSNYCNTLLSLPSSLNMCYLDELAQEVGIHSSDYRPLRAMLNNNKVAHLLRSQGYLFVSFASGAGVTESLRNVDHYFRPRTYLSEFEQALLTTTPLLVLNQNLPGHMRDSILHLHEGKRQLVLHTFDHLADPRNHRQSVFVYAHIMCPHPPFVFERNGALRPRGPYDGWYDPHDVHGSLENKVERDEHVRGYIDQVVFINKSIIAAVDRILSASAKPVIIALQGDHGPALNLHVEDMQLRSDPKERLSILNAYLVPEEIEAQLYDEITPVNTFRLILGYLRGTDYQLLDDRSYFSSGAHPYSFIDVTEEVQGERSSRD